MPLPWAEPFAAALNLRDEPGLVLLESRPGFGALGRRSFLAVRPSEIATRGLADLERLDGGWWAGWLSYDLGRQIEELPSLAEDDLGLPPLSLGRYDAWLEFDHDRRTVQLRGDGRGDASRPGAPCKLGGTPAAAACAMGELSAAPPLRARGRAGDRLHPRRRRVPGEPLPAAQRRIGTATHSPSMPGCGETSPAPFMALVRLGGADVSPPRRSGSSAVRGDRIETRPIKGTRPRGQDPAADARLAAALRASAKDRAENVMIVDLARNDLGRVARVRHRRGRAALRASSLIPGCTTSSRPSSARLRPGDRRRRRRAGNLPARIRDGRAEDPSARDHRGARAGPARPVLRRDRLVRAGRRPRALGRDPHLRGGASSACTCMSAERWRRTPIPLTSGARRCTRRRACCDAAGGTLAARAGTDRRTPREGLAQRAARRRARRPACRPPTTASWSATACSRRCAATRACRSRSSEHLERLRGRRKGALARCRPHGSGSWRRAHA